MYIPQVQEPVPMFILGDSAFASDSTVLPAGVQPLPTSPSSGTITNNNLQDPYYFNSDGTLITGQYNYIFVPINYQIDLQQGHIYVYNESASSWSPFQLTSQWFHVESAQPFDADMNQYKVYRFYSYDTDEDEYKSVRYKLSFNII